MKRLILWSLPLLLATELHAQQVTDITQQAQEQAATPPAESTVPAPAASQPVVAPAQATATVVVAKPKSPFDFSAGFIFHPLAYDAEDYFMELNPSATIATTFNAFGDKSMNASLNWDLSMSYFVTSEANPEDEKSYTNAFTAALNSDVMDKLNLSVNGVAKINNQNSDLGGNEIWLESNPAAKYKILPTTTVLLGYTFIYFVRPDNNLSFDAIDAGGAPVSESGDVGKSLFAGTSNGGSGAFAFDPAAPGDAADFSNDFFQYIHELVTGVNHKFTPTTSIDAKYWFGRFISNNDDAEAFENKLGLTISQTLWENTTIGASWVLRVLDYIYANGDNGTDARRDYRNRISFDVGQKLNDLFALDFHYRYQKTFSNNSAAEDDPGSRHQLWAGASVSF